MRSLMGISCARGGPPVRGTTAASGGGGVREGPSNELPADGGGCAYVNREGWLAVLVIATSASRPAAIRLNVTDTLPLTQQHSFALAYPGLPRRGGPSAVRSAHHCPSSSPQELHGP